MRSEICYILILLLLYGVVSMISTIRNYISSYVFAHNLLSSFSTSPQSNVKIKSYLDYLNNSFVFGIQLIKYDGNYY